jgi:hypothetical protein
MLPDSLLQARVEKCAVLNSLKKAGSATISTRIELSGLKPYDNVAWYKNDLKSN